jgi:hypothetical protein
MDDRQVLARLHGSRSPFLLYYAYQAFFSFRFDENQDLQRRIRGLLARKQDYLELDQDTGPARARSHPRTTSTRKTPC